MSNPVEKNSYLFMGTKRIAKDSNGTISYYYTDHLGSTRAVDVSGEISRLDYAPFGEDFRPTSERYKFTGKEDDGSTGLHYFNARYYDPAIGRFITEDPAMDGINWYVYCGNSPLRYVDLDGKSLEDVFKTFKGFLDGIAAYSIESALEEMNQGGTGRNNNWGKYKKTPTKNVSDLGYKAAEFVDENNIYMDVTVTVSTKYPDFAVGVTKLYGNKNYKDAIYVHGGVGKSFPPLVPASLSFAVGVVKNADTPQDFEKSFWNVNANVFSGIEYSWMQDVSSKGISLSTAPSIGGRYDWYYLIDYIDLNK